MIEGFEDNQQLPNESPKLYIKKKDNTHQSNIEENEQ